MGEYQEFLERKMQTGADFGFKKVNFPDPLFDFQKSLVEYAVRKGRGAVFADCGLGKTAIQLSWAQNIVESTNKHVLVLTPLAVSQQTIREGEKFGIGCIRSNDGSLPMWKGITVTNYERLHHFNANDFSGCVCDESSILKNYDGARRSAITEFMRKMPYRLLCTATAAPNDYVELGTSSEALGYLGHVDMLNRFFKNDKNNSAQNRHFGKQTEWRFKGHAEHPFWRWVCSWARAIRKPSDIGFEDGAFVLPPIYEKEHIVEPRSLVDGLLFNLPALTLFEQREERRRTISERCEYAAELANSHPRSILWCHLNDEGDLLEEMVESCVQVSGSQSDDEKEELLLAFSTDQVPRIIIKPRIGCFGLNWQHCSHAVTFPSHSFEGYYQSVRRIWRFGQRNPVDIDIVASAGERGILANIQRKAKAADKMFEHLVEKMTDELRIINADKYTEQEAVPSWL